jgi:hypothetical protein
MIFTDFFILFFICPNAGRIAGRSHRNDRTVAIRPFLFIEANTISYRET